MNGRAGLQRAAPWVFCWISLALLVTGSALRIAFPEGPDDGVFYAAVGVLSFSLVPLVGALVAARLPANPYGWLWCALGIVLGVLAACDGLRRTGVVPGLTATLRVASSWASLCLLLFVLLLFPTGELPGRPWRWLARAAVLVAGSGILILPFAPSSVDAAEPTRLTLEGRAGGLLDDVLRGGAGVLFLFILLAAASLVVRFRRAGPIERQQLKWFLLAAALVTGTTALDVLQILPMSDPVSALVDAVAFALFPVAVGIAVLRYRLYEIDRIVSRTVSYGLLSAALIALYLLVVNLLRPLLEPVTGNSSIAVAASTLAVAAVFNPARRRLQAVVDRRFDRARYDAGRAVDAFARRLRNQVDLDEVTEGLRDTVAATVAPTRVAVWLRVPSGTGGG